MTIIDGVFARVINHHKNAIRIWVVHIARKQCISDEIEMEWTKISLEFNEMSLIAIETY